jgi:predicted permease
MSGFVERALQALRLLRRHKRFAALAIISLAIGIALNTTMYGVLDTMIAPKLLIPRHEELQTVDFLGNYRRRIPEAELEATIRQEFLASFASGVTGTRSSFADRSVEGGGVLMDALVNDIQPNYFQVLGVRASHGRLIGPSDVGADMRPVVLAERVWKKLFPDQKTFEPATVYIAGDPRLMVGTLPYQADFPGSNTGVWQLPLPENISAIPNNIARIKTGYPLSQVASVLETLRLRFAERTGEYNPGDAGWRVWAATKPPFRVNRFHFALIGAVLTVLLVACANLANLQLARGVSRARELATRAAVGASRANIVWQLVIESAWLALGGLVLGAVLTGWAMKIVDASVPPMVTEYVTHPQVSWRVAVFALVATLFCLMMVGLAPAIKLSRVDINDLLKSGAGTGESRTARRRYGVLVAVEVALAMSVLCSAALLSRAALRVLAFDSGIGGQGLVSTRISVAPLGPTDRRTRQAWTEELIQQALGVTNVTHAAVTRSEMPRTHYVADDNGGGAARNHFKPMWSYLVVSPDFVTTMGLPIIKGSDFSAGFREPSVIVDRATAAYLWPAANPVGRLMKLDSSTATTPWYRVVGVAENMQLYFGRSDEARARAIEPHIGAVYVLQSNDTAVIQPPPRRQRYSASFQIYVRATGDERTIPATLHRELTEVGGRNLVSYPLTWAQSSGVDRMQAKHTFMASLFLTFGLMALALAALGVYAIIAHMVAQRTREFGVRIAIGAAARDIGTLVLREGSILTLIGIAVGLLLTAYSAGFVREFVFSDDDRYDSRVFAVVCLIIFGIAWVASYVPARRAMRINPVEALRND